MENRRLTIDLPADLHEKFRTIAFFSKVTMKDMVIEKIKEVVKEYEKEQKKELQSK